MRQDPAINVFGWAAALLMIASCGTLPTTGDSLTLPSGVTVQPPTGSRPTASSAIVSSPVVSLLPDHELSLRVERRPEDWVVTLPAPHVNRWLARESGAGVEWIDVNLTVGSYRQTATAQLRADQSAVFTFTDAPAGDAQIEAIAFRGTETVARGQARWGSTEVATTALSTDSPATAATAQTEPMVLILDPADVPMLQGIQGASITSAGRVVEMLDPAQLLMLTGKNLEQVAQITFASLGTTGGTTPVLAATFLEQTDTTLRLRPPSGLGRTSLITVTDANGLGLGTFAVNWQTPSPTPATPISSPTPAAPISSPTPFVDLRLSPLPIDDSRLGSWEDPRAVVMGADGSLYIADAGRHQILRRDPNGILHRVAGSGASGYRDGAAAEAQFNQPVALAWDPEGHLWVADRGNQRIRRLSPQGQVTTVAGSGTAGWQDGSALQAQFRDPQGLTVAEDGSVYIADTGNHRIRQLTVEGEVITVAGGEQAGLQEGSPDESLLDGPSDVLWDPSRQTLWISDTGNHRIRRLTDEGDVVTVAGSEAGLGDGTLDRALFDSPTTLQMDPTGSLWINDAGNARLRRLRPQDRVSTITGIPSGSPTPQSRLDMVAFAAHPDGSWIVLERSPLQLRRLGR